MIEPADQVGRGMVIQNYDEVDFTDQGSGSPAFMHLGKSEGGDISIGFAVIDSGELDLTVSIEDARRLGERLVAVANEIASGQ
jgi:hypothetical protein